MKSSFYVNNKIWLSFRRNQDLTPYPHGHNRVFRRERAQSPEIPMPFNPGGFESALKLKRFDGHIIISKKYSLKDWLEFVNGNIDIMPKIAISSDDFEYLLLILRNIKEIQIIHLHFERIYSQDYEDFVNKVRRNFQGHTIIIGTGPKENVGGVGTVPKHYSRAKNSTKVFQLPVPVLQTANQAQIDHVPTQQNKQPFNITLYRQLQENEQFGFSIRPGTGFIRSIEEGSPAQRCGKLNIGDKVIAINNVEITSGDIVGIIKDTDDSALFTIEGIYAIFSNSS